MTKCADCSEPYDATQKARFKCSGNLCHAWTHKQCSHKSQIANNGYWYCTEHLNEIPLNMRKSNMTETESTDETEKNDKEKEETPFELPSGESEVSKTITNNKDLEKNNENSKEKFISLHDSNSETHVRDSNVTKRSKKKVVPFDDDNDFNPFSNFTCDCCDDSFTKDSQGVLCSECRSTFHLKCLNKSEVEDVKNSIFVCQHCIQNQIRLENLKEGQKRDMKAHNNVPISHKSNKNANSKDRSKKFSSSTPNRVQHKSNKSSTKHKKILDFESANSCSEDSFSSNSSDSSCEQFDSKLKKKYEKLKKLYKKHNKTSKHQIILSSSADSNPSEESNNELSQTEAMISLYKFTRDERNKSKFEKLPIVDNVDTKWSVFFDLFKQSRKLFSDSENVLRIQTSIKCKEILEIGGISLLDPRTYWQAIKLINERLTKSFNLLQKETNEIIKLKQLKYDSDNKKIIEFINKIINYSHIIDRYGSKKHKVDDRVISHIGNIMPRSMINGWHKVKSKLEDKNKTVYIKHVADYLCKQVPYITSKLQAEDLDPWKETNPKTFKKNESSFKRSYNTHYNKSNNDVSESFSNYCWLHKSKNHSSFKCSKLWEMSGKEVSDLARKNNVCTFCGNKRHKDCHAAKALNCKIENCSLKHHILFCYKRKGKTDKNYNNHNDDMRNRDNTQNRNSRNFKRQPKPNNQNENNSNHQEDEQSNMSHRKDDENNYNKQLIQDEEEIVIPSSNFYINQPPKTIRIKRNNDNYNINSTFSTFIEMNSNNTIRSELFQNHNTLTKVTNTASCILGVGVIKFVDNNEKIALLLDSGSTVSIIEEEIANKLELKGIWSPLRLSWSSDLKRVDYGSRIIKAKVSGTKSGSNTFNIFFRTVKDLHMIDQPFDAAEMIEIFTHLQPMNLNSYCKVHGIIGLDNIWCFEQQKIFKPKYWNHSMPYGIRCPLGDFVVGCLHQLEDLYNYLKNNDCNTVSTNATMNNITFSESEERDLAEMERIVVGQEYNLLSSDDNNYYDDSLALDLLHKHVKRSDNNVNFEAPLLWRTTDVVLPTDPSFKIAYKRLLIVEKNSIKNGRFNECIEQVENLLKKNYAEIVPTHEVNAKGGKIFYLPTFFIQPKNKRTRFIWDAATKVEGKSLNDFLLSGPNMYNSYLQIILQMREGRYLIKGDLQEMFHQIVIRKEDRDSLRFLFRKSPNERLQVLRMRVMIFGSKSSPATSQFVKNKIAEEFIHSHPHAAHVILNQTYVDDVITSVDDLQCGKTLILDVRNILKTGGFNLVKLNSNNEDILQLVRNNLSKDDTQNGKIFSKEVIEKLLGYNVNFETDELSIALSLDKIPQSILNCSEKPTKKQVLQLCMSIFDPIGFMEFLLSKFKLIYHWLIKDGYEWNQIMGDEYFAVWKKCMSWLKELTNIKIPRWYSNKLSNASIVQLVGFGDAGTQMLCATVYLRLLDTNRNQIDYKFIGAKSYTVPLKQSRTVPDLEVDIACKLATLMYKIELAHNIKFHEKLYFTDNAAIREWIVNDAKNPKVYVKNRLNKIRQLTKKEEWRWTPTNLQPADFGTKLSSMPKLTYFNDWFHPLLFQMPENNWPEIEANNNSILYHTLNTSHDDISDEKSFISKFSSFDKLINAIQKCLEWKYRVNIIKVNKEIKNCRSVEIKTRAAKKKKMKLLIDLRKKKCAIYESMNEIRENYSLHELTLFRISQEESFKDEYLCLSGEKPIKKSSQLYKILPYLDKDGVMRSLSRITDNEENRRKFGTDRINPIVLHRDSHLTKLIILKYHNSMAHHNEKTVVINLLQRFYINKIRRTVNNVIRKECLNCRIAHAKPVAPLMGDIPFTRLAFFKTAFTYAMADLLGPINVKVTRFITSKRYVLVYSCLTTRGLHLELIESLDSNATLRALQNIFNTRGAPIRICTDNGTNFTGGNNIMQKNHVEWNEKLLKRMTIVQPIEWYFSPAKAPHMNGAVERMVGLVKKALKGVQQYLDKTHSLYDDFGLKSVLCEIMNMINSRPIEILPPDEDQNVFLTPNLFLIGRQNAQSVPVDSDPPKTLSQQWKDIKIISNIIWEKWLKSFFPIMLQREKWIDRTNPLKVGDIVITADPTIANSWRKGIVTEIKMGSKEQVRHVIVRLGKNKAIENGKSLNRNQIMRAYQSENDTIVSRPATMIAKINIDNE